MNRVLDQLENKVERQGDDNVRNEIKKESDGGERQQKRATTGIRDARNRQIAVQNGLL